MKTRLFLISAMLLMTVSTAFSQGLSKGGGYYVSKDGSYYFTGNMVIVGQPTDGAFHFISPVSKVVTPIVSGDTIQIKSFYVKNNTIIAEGLIVVNGIKTKCNIAFETAIETGELLSFEKVQELNEKYSQR